MNHFFCQQLAFFSLFGTFAPRSVPNSSGCLGLLSSGQRYLGGSAVGCCQSPSTSARQVLHCRGSGSSLQGFGKNRHRCTAMVWRQNPMEHMQVWKTEMQSCPKAFLEIISLHQLPRWLLNPSIPFLGALGLGPRAGCWVPWDSGCQSWNVFSCPSHPW